MVQDALDGKIDLILAKSLSRFSRNTVDSLTTTRKLKENAVEVWFEKEAIKTFDGRGYVQCVKMIQWLTPAYPTKPQHKGLSEN